MSSIPARSAEVPGRWIPWAFVAFFGVVFAVNATMIAIAFTTWTGLTTERSYQRGLDYNRALEAAAAQEALGWRVDFAFIQGQGAHAVVEVGLENRHRDLLEAADVEARFLRPTHAGHDVTVVLPHYRDGRYRAEVELPFAGQWDVHVTASSGGDVYRLSRRVFLRP
jgi:nitrogen fixation protein FixH